MIEKIVLDSTQDVANVIDSLGWFDSVTVNGTTVTGVIDSVTHLSVNVAITGGAAATGTPGVSFYTKGNGETGNRTISQAHNSALHRFAVKTANGIIFASHSSAPSNQSYFCWMLAKTTNGKIAAVVPATNNYSSGGERYLTAAIEETSANVPGGYISLCKQGSVSSGNWDDSTQIVGTPIPTHATSGTSVIKNGMGFILCPTVELGKRIINGTEYATNGIFALSDED